MLLFEYTSMFMLNTIKKYITYCIQKMTYKTKDKRSDIFHLEAKQLYNYQSFLIYKHGTWHLNQTNFPIIIRETIYIFIFCLSM